MSQAIEEIRELIALILDKLGHLQSSIENKVKIENSEDKEDRNVPRIFSK